MSRAPHAGESTPLYRCCVGFVAATAMAVSMALGPATAAAQKADERSASAREPDEPVVPSSQRGLASFYARMLDGRVTASGTKFDNDAMIAAHPRYPFGTVLRVTNLENGRSIDVEVVDRGPARGPRADGVIIDLSRAAAEALGFVEEGRTRVRLEIRRLAADDDDPR